MAVLESKLDQKMIGYVTTFETLTRARVKDLFLSVDGVLLFVVYQGEGGKAIGKGGAHIRRLMNLLRKKIKVIELSSAIDDFVKNVIDPLVADAIEVHGDVVTVSLKDITMKGKLIGRNGKNLKLLNALVEKYFQKHVAVA